MNLTDEKFTQLIQENEGRLKHLSRIYANQEGDEKDLFQEMIIQIWRSLPSFQGDAKIETWIYRLAVNTAISFVRKKKTRKDYYSKYKKENKTGIPEREQVTQKPKTSSKVQKLCDAISSLNAAEKAIITMYLEDFSYSEIAFVADISENYVGVKLHRIKNELAKMIGDKNGIE